MNPVPDLTHFRCQRCGACCRIPGGLVRLRDRPDGACEMLGGDGLCRVHAAKPAQCREFPFSWRNPDSFRLCPGLRAIACGGREPKSHAEFAE